jgi:hypothetical protein
VTLVVLQAGARGFDANSALDASQATRMAETGYTFAIRYIRRQNAAASDLTAAEISVLQSVGLSCMAVQHVESESSWIANGDKGLVNGEAAAVACKELQLPAGVSVWCDLEGVDPSVPAADVEAYCRAWYDAVQAVGMLPGLYVGWNAGLNAEQLYALPFTRYWRAYNLNSDQAPATRGCCMSQALAMPADDPLDLGIDVDTVTVDALGGLPVAFGA